MLAEQWLAVIKAEREREIKAIQRAHLVRRKNVEGEPGDASAPEVERSIGRTVRRVAQPGRATADPSL
jgi:hypothetical protein